MLRVVKIITRILSCTEHCLKTFTINPPTHPTTTKMFKRYHQYLMLSTDVIEKPV